MANVSRIMETQNNIMVIISTIMDAVKYFVEMILNIMEIKKMIMVIQFIFYNIK
jgi:hypothetical protein